MIAQHPCEMVLRVEHKVEVSRNGLRTVPDESEWPLLIRAASHVSAEVQGRGAFLLSVPRASLPNEVSVLDPESRSRLDVFPQGRVSLGQYRFGEVAVDDAELAFDERVTVFLGSDDS